MESCEDFIKKIKKASEPRIYKITHSYGAQQAYRYYMKLCHSKKQEVLESTQYYQIIRAVNKKIGESLLIGEQVVLPERMGSLQVLKQPCSVRIKDGELYIPLPIDWNETLKLWYEDKEARDNKTILRHDIKEIYKVVYVKYRATYTNKGFYKFTLTRDLKKKLKYNIQEGLIDAFLLYKY